MIIGTTFPRTALALAILFLTAACGQSTDTDKTASLNAPAAASSSNYLKITRDEYGLLTPNFYYSSDNAYFWSIQASVADSVNDPNYRCIIRIDIPKTENRVIQLAGKTYSLGDDTRNEKFPGEFYVFNGHASAHKKIEQGTISFSTASDLSLAVTGTFDVVVADHDSQLAQKPRYRIAGEFAVAVGSSGPANPLPAEIYPTLGKDAYDGSCASCHALGEYDSSAESAPEMAMRGGELPTVYDAAAAHHQAIALDDGAMTALRVFVNAW